jgi:hypothetical protein
MVACVPLSAPTLVKYIDAFIDYNNIECNVEEYERRQKIEKR